MRCLKRYIAREVYRVYWSRLPRHHDPLGAVYERRCGVEYGLALDYKSVTVGELTLW